MKVLVGYASAHGSTEGIAERIAADLVAQGYRVDVLPMRRGKDVSAYGAVVLGSAIHDRSWLPEATEFVSQHVDELRGRPVWLFGVGMLGDEGSAFSPALAYLLRRLSRGRMDSSECLDRIHPRAYRKFVGVIARDHLSRTGHVLFKMMGGRYGDHRHWQKIDAWAGSIARGLQHDEVGMMPARRA